MAQQQIIERKTRQEWAAVINADWRKSIEGIVQTGRDLNAAKDDLPNGQFGKMVAEDLDFSRQTAVKLMKIANTPQIASDASRRQLPPNWRILAELAGLKKQEFDWAQKRGLISADTSLRGATALRGALKTPEGEVWGANHKQTTLPSAAEAKSIAKETGRIVAASDGKMYTGASDEETAEYKDRRGIVYSIADAIKTINKQPDPREWFGQFQFWWKSEFSAADTEAAAEWLSGLADALRDEGHE